MSKHARNIRVSDKNSKEPNTLSGFRSIETLSQIIPIFSQSFPCVFAVRDFDILDVISCSRNDGTKGKSFLLMCVQNFISSRGICFQQNPSFIFNCVTRYLCQIDALCIIITHSLHITLRLTNK